MQVNLISATHFFGLAAERLTGWSTDAEGGQALAEFAGRACYQSWKKPNPETATNAGYLRHILEVGHLSVLEHGHAGFYLTGLSRSLTHELIRHRHFSYSQLSQRYVAGLGDLVMPPEAVGDPVAEEIVSAAAVNAELAYDLLVAHFEAKLAGEDLTPTLRRKRARQAARAVLPNATETKIVVTGNYRAWRHFIKMRATEHADVEIRALAIEILMVLQLAVPNVFMDYQITRLADGTQVASSPYGGGDD